ncbi:type I-E CRISPR-associated protein Cse2/CasB [Actinomadura chibensis]|nr:type I-E CRISPR-associated protein Cse2/CasB [Actinomadura chibensis]
MTSSTTAVRPRWQAELAVVLDAFLVRRNQAVDFDRAGLAACRRGLSKKPMDIPAMFQYIAPVSLAVPARWGPQAQARVEAAAHYTLALYAFHQQSQDRRMHQPSQGRQRTTVGRAAGRLHQALQSTSPEGVDRRFLAAATADSIEEVVGHLRVLVPQLRQHAIPMDYLALAADLESWPVPELRAQTRRRWGLDYRWIPSTEDDQDDTTDTYS